MAASLNKVMLIGNLTRDPELRYLPSGQGVTTFTLAVNRVYHSQSGDKKEDVSFIRIVVWAKLAEICNEYLKKGSAVFVEGRLQSRSWETPEGGKRSAIEVVAQSVQFLSKSTRAQDGAMQAEDDSAIFDEPSQPGPGKKSVSISDNELQPDDEVPF